MQRAALLLLLLPSLASAAAPASADDLAFFEKKIRPLLHARCLECHSAKKVRGGLRLDSRTHLEKGGDSGKVVVAGKPEQSLLVQAVKYEHDSVSMPPTGKLAASEIALFVEWVKRGAVYPGPTATATKPDGIDLVAGRKFWSFQPLKTHSLPKVQNASWPRQRIDSLLLSAMEANGLTPSAEADRATLIRRVTFDLIGLPPSPDEVDSFVRDTSVDAYARLVERLLASPRHGERWGRFWLDLVRYCDVAEPWAGLKGSPHLYRDWVVEALNDDLPYDAFVKKQLAADLMTGSVPRDKVALGLLGLAPTYWKELKLDHQVIKGVVAEEWEERIHTLTSTFLGLTAACARCHDHKFDPISQRDYYGLAGVFASVRQVDLPLTSIKGGPIAIAVSEASLIVEADGPNKTKLLWKSQPQDVALQVRGNPAVAGPVVKRRFFEVLSPDKPRSLDNGSGRLDLAKAIVEEGGPLAARVIVNRVWKHHFGEGIVRTPSDLGSQGDRPAHPELLDDLAARFVANGWSLKWLHREIVLSAAYRQSGRGDRAKSAKDPENRLLWRGPRRRLEVEAWRDAILAASGCLDGRLGGASIDLAKADNARRTIYGTVKRRELNDLLRLYDFPDPTTHSPSRTPTTTAVQQLFVLNSPFLKQQSEALARRVQGERKTDRERIDRVYRLLFARGPSAGEVKLGKEFLAESSWAQYAQVLLATGEFAMVE